VLLQTLDCIAHTVLEALELDTKYFIGLGVAENNVVEPFTRARSATGKIRGKIESIH
jgi:hypothetical protein